MVAPFEGPHDIAPLRGLVTNSIRDLLRMPKTLIFLDGVETAQRINLELQKEVSEHLQGVPPDVFIRTYWASIDDEQKDATLKDLRSGRTRIVLCTDAFSLGVKRLNQQTYRERGLPRRDHFRGTRGLVSVG